MKTVRHPIVALYVALLVCVAGPTAVAADKGLVVTPNHADGVYTPGDDVRWKIEWKGDGDAPASADFVIKSGGLTQVVKGTLPSLPGTVGTKFDKPGTLLLEVKAGGKRAVGGAVAGADKIEPSSPRPSDFDAFWDGKIKALNAIPPNPQLDPADGEKGGIDYWKITLDNINNTKIRGQLARPKQGEKLPAMLIVQWAGVYPLQKEWMNGYAEGGWLVLNISAHDLPAFEPDSFYREQEKPGGPVHNYPAIGNDDRETSYFLRMYLSCYRAAEYLATRPDWDGKTLVVMGGSQGGQQSLVTAAIHPKVTAAMANVPAGCDMLGPDAGRQGGWPMWYWQTGGKDAKKVREASRYFDVVNFAPRIKCPVLIGIGLLDETCPPAGIYAAANRITAPKELILLSRGGHQNEGGSHKPYDERLWGAWLPALLKSGQPPAPVPSANVPKQAASAAPVRSEPYAWRNVPIVGGGFHSGVVTHPKQKGLMYVRTDIGGAYRRDEPSGKWQSITDWIDQERWTYTGIESLAIDPSDPKYVYLAAGSYTNDWSGPGAILRSTDQGKTFQVTPLPFKNGGNEDGRGNGERLSVDPNDGRVLVFGSRRNGLWRSTDRGETWNRVESFPEVGDTRGIGIVFTTFDPRSGRPGSASNVIYAGVSSRTQHLFRSADAGKSWSPVPNQPTGFVPHHCAWDADGTTLYVTYGNGPGPNGVTDGAVYKLDTKTDAWTNVTPVKPGGEDKFGYAGVTVGPQRAGTVVVSTLNRWAKVDDLFRSTDGGKTWASIREKSVRDVSLAPWLAQDKDNVPFGHWIHDVEIDPHDPDRAIYVTGWGMWETKDLTRADKQQPTHWTIGCNGTEMVVVNEVLSPPAGAARVLSAVWDLDGFRHTTLDRAPQSHFTPHYGRNTSIDFAEKDPNVVVRVYGGQEMGGTRPAGTGGSYSTDNGATWTAFASKPAGGRNDGTIAVSADGATFVWTPDGGGRRGGGGEGAATHVSRDRGKSWVASTGLPPRLRVVSDRADANAFYAFDPRAGTVYASSDGGATFAAKAGGLPAATGNNGGNDVQLRAVPGHAGGLWLATKSGLHVSTDGGQTFAPVAGVDRARRVGFGKAAEGADFPAVFITGVVAGQYGIYRSDDRGASWLRVNDDQHQFAEISSLTGDPREHGRVYLSSRNRGILLGEPAR